jgi:sulfonate transport system ATP-binding protein
LITAHSRALVHRPRLLLDGPLDALTRIEMQQLIETLWQQHGFTALPVTHEHADAGAADARHGEHDDAREQRVPNRGLALVGVNAARTCGTLIE